MTKTVFLDSAVIIAGFHSRDADHAAGLAILRAADRKRIGPAIITDFVLAEVLNFLTRKGGSAVARDALDRLEASPGISIHRVPDSVYLAGKTDVFQNMDGLSFVDSITVAFMRHNKIRSLYTFDQGFDRVPGIDRLAQV